MKWSDLEQFVLCIFGVSFEPNEARYRAEMRTPGKCVVSALGQPDTSCDWVAIDAEVAPARIPSILRVSGCSVSASVALCGDSDDVVALTIPVVADVNLAATLEALGVEVLEAGGQS